MKDNYSFSKTVNNFIDILTTHSETIEVVKVNDKETIIYYESWDHEPIKNFHAEECRNAMRAKMSGKNNPMCNPEILAKKLKTMQEKKDAKTNKLKYS
jgi:hypothetical protein